MDPSEQIINIVKQYCQSTNQSCDNLNDETKDTQRKMAEIQNLLKTDTELHKFLYNQANDNLNSLYDFNSTHISLTDSDLTDFDQTPISFKPANTEKPMTFKEGLKELWLIKLRSLLKTKFDSEKASSILTLAKKLQNKYYPQELKLTKEGQTEEYIKNCFAQSLKDAIDNAETI